MDEMPLAGLKVVAFEQAVAAPLCSRHLADLGADVIKIERPGEGDFARSYDSVIHGTSTWFAWLNRRKRSVTLDLKSEAGIEIAHSLVAGCDVVVQNFAPGALERLGLGVDQLRERHPSLVAASISGYGEEGPYRDRKAYDLLLQAETGVLSVTGTAEQPSKAGVSLVDLSAGMYAFSSILAGLYRRQQTGEGASIRVSLFDSIMEWMSPLSLMAAYGTPPRRAGARHASIVPYGPYRVAGGREVVLAIQNEREWQRLCGNVLLRPELALDPRYAANDLRLRNRQALEEEIEDALAAVPLQEVEARLESASLAYGRLNDVSEVLRHPQVLARERLVNVAVAAGRVDLLRAPFNIQGVEEAPSRVPGVGEHTREVLLELGLSEAAIRELRQARVIE